MCLAISENGVKLTLPAGSVVLTDDEALKLASALVEAAAVARGDDPDEHDWRRVPVQFLHFEAEQGSEEEPETAPQFASVRCWVSGQSRANAAYVAAGWIMDEGWTVTDLIEQAEVTRTDYEGTEYERYYDQVLTDGEVFLFEIAGDDEEEGEAVE